MAQAPHRGESRAENVRPRAFHGRANLLDRYIEIRRAAAAAPATLHHPQRRKRTPSWSFSITHDCGRRAVASERTSLANKPFSGFRRAHANRLAAEETGMGKHCVPGGRAVPDPWSSQDIPLHARPRLVGAAADQYQGQAPLDIDCSQACVEPRFRSQSHVPQHLDLPHGSQSCNRLCHRRDHGLRWWLDRLDE